MTARILVIDDEESIRFTFDRLLRNAGSAVDTAASLADGIEKLISADYDLVFVDILLGGDSGIEVLRAMKARNISAPLVFITGYPSFGTASEAVRLGAFDYLAKPVDKEALLDITKRALQHKKAMDQRERERANLEAIFRSVQDAIMMVNKDLVVLELNLAAQEHYGLSRNALGKPFQPQFESCCGKCRETLQKVIETKTPMALSHIECRAHGDSGLVMNLTACPLIDSEGAVYGAVLVARDETRCFELPPERAERWQFHGIIGRCEKMQRIYALVEALADLQSSVLVLGESGTGKELLAEAIHYAGKRRDKPLVKVNCSALSENLLESELFGHVRGAFTGAVKDKVGRFQLAHGGTLFLDEIGDVSPGIQQRLLRVLQEREFERVGDSRCIKVDVRVIAATNKNLLARIKSGQFREDLYYRLKVVEIALPPLRERGEDIPLLVDYFIKKFNQKLNKHIEAVSEDVLNMFMRHPWPGNVRQLAHTLEHAFVLCQTTILTIDHLPTDFKASADLETILKEPGQPASESQAILQALHRAAGNKAMAARLLGISRRTLYRKLVEHGIVLD